MKWRRLRSVLLSIILGVMTAVGTAGYGWHSVHAWRNRALTDHSFKVVPAEGRIPGTDDHSWNWGALRGRAFTNCDLELAKRPREDWEVNDAVPEWIDVRARASAMLPGEEAYRESQYGFPLRCLRAAIAVDYSKPYETRCRYLAGFDVGWHDGGYVEQGALPSGALWPGLLADIGLFAVVWLGAIEMAKLGLRSRRRRRALRGICSCGYDRRGLAADAKCPECGSVPSPK